MTTSRFPVHTIATAPDAAKPTLEEVGRKYGFVPNLMGVFASAPGALQAYLAISEQFARTSLPADEREVVLLTTARANECVYCVAVHSATATMAKVPAQVIGAIREDRPIPDARLESVRRLTRAIVISRGWPSEDDIAAFLAAGHQPAQILEVVLGVTLKTLSNYTNHLAQQPLDGAFAAHRWDKPVK
jgi:uncharacterized peroxidase-related enzyme